MAVDFTDFTTGGTFASDNYLVGYDVDASGGEKKWKYDTLMRSISGDMTPQLLNLANSTNISVLNGPDISLALNSKTLSATISVPASADQTLTYDAVQQKWVNQRTFPTWNSTPATSAQNLQLSGASINGFVNWQRAMTDVIRNNRDIVGDRLTTPSGTYPGTSEALYNSVVLKDGRVFFVPFNATQAYIFDPVLNSVTTTSAGSFPGGGAFSYGVLLSDGRVYIGPHGWTSSQTTARIYDPTTNLVTIAGGTFPTGTINGNGLETFYGSVLLPDGRVYIIPDSHQTAARIYDPSTNTLSIPNGTFPDINDAFVGGTLLPDGRVFIFPRTSTNARIYDPVANTLTVPTGNYGGAFNFSAGCLLPNGKLFIASRVSTTARIYDPLTDTVTTPNGTFSGNPTRPIVLPNGKVLIIDSPTCKIYDPVNDITTNSGITLPSGLGPPILLSNGKLIFAPKSSATTRFYETTDSYQPITLDINFVTSPFINRGS